jgi:hypothetical protein
MDEQIVCPVCEGRGVYCRQTGDSPQHALAHQDLPCQLCDGRGKVWQEEAREYFRLETRPDRPFAEM